MGEQLDLYDPRTNARSTDLDTSKDAARSIRPNALLHKILKHLREVGPRTGIEVAIDLGLEHHQCQKRVSDLKRLKLIQDTGDRRLNPISGRSSAVWGATDARD
jgi:hypothetical protein